MPPPTPTRPSATQWLRILWLDQQIRGGHYPSAADLQEEYDIGRRHAFHAISFLRDSLGAPIAYNRERRGYHYTDATFLLPQMVMAEGEMLSLILARELTRSYLGTAIDQPLRQAMEKLTAFLPQKVQIGLQHLADSFHIAGGAGVDLPIERLAMVQEAVTARRAIRIQYYSPRRDTTGWRTVQPHFIQNIRGDWMVVAWEPAIEAPRTFMIARIRELQLLEEHFQRRPELAPDLYNAGAFQVEHHAETHSVVLRFDNYQARWIRERRSHASQEIEELDDGCLLLRMQVHLGDDLARWILSYGPHVEVLAPPELRQRISQAHRSAAGLYPPAELTGEPSE